MSVLSETWACILSLAFLLFVCSKLSQRDKLLSVGRKKFNMDPEKVGSDHSKFEDKAVRKFLLSTGPTHAKGVISMDCGAGFLPH